MTETCLISGEMKMELSGADGAAGIAEDEYIEFGISPFDELHEIELSINEALENGGEDILPALYLFNYCRNLVEGGDMEEYTEACNILCGLCRVFSGNRGGRLRPVGDYLDFYID